MKLSNYETNQSELIEEVLALLNDNLQRERTYVSMAHRDDLSFNVNGMDAQTYGSQGQQRTTALSIKLAEID